MADLSLMSAPAEVEESSAPSPIRVLLAAHHALLSSGLLLLLDAEQDIEMVAETHDLEAAVRHIRRSRPHVLVLDLGLLAGSACQTIGELRARAPGTQVVLLTMDETPVIAQHLLACGALGFVLKDHADDELAPAVHAAARGQEYLSPGIARRLDDAMHPSGTR